MAQAGKGTTAFDGKAFRAGGIAALVGAAAIVLGSRNLRDFDWALTTYAVGSIFAAFAVVYRYAVWAQRPPTRMYLKRGFQAFFARKRGWSSTPRNAGTLGKLLLDNFVLQKFITRRGTERWIMHACLSWGGMLAFARDVSAGVRLDSLRVAAGQRRDLSRLRRRVSRRAVRCSQPERIPALQPAEHFGRRSAGRASCCPSSCA